MTVETVVDRSTPPQWHRLASAFADYTIYQSWAFVTCRAAEANAEVSRIIVRRGDKVLGMAQVRIKRIPWMRAGLAYIFRGPLWRRQGCSPADLQTVLEAIHAEYALHRGLEVRLIPNLPACMAGENVLEAFAQTGFLVDPSATAYRTIRLDLSPPLGELRSRLRGNWRNHLKQAEKRGLTVQVAKDAAGMARFADLYAAMIARKKFETDVRVSTFREVQRELGEAERQHILLVLENANPVAGHVLHLMGDTCISLLGATVQAGMKCKASYLVQWRTIELAKEAGARWYDLGGIDPEENPGVYHFKAGLNGQECTFIGQFTARGSSAGKYLVPLAERAYKVLKPTRRPSARQASGWGS
jgi:lipid II:glycine glycyltransferase (peptidoglycan interpeptide bridge formation enzyme)